MADQGVVPGLVPALRRPPASVLIFWIQQNKRTWFIFFGISPRKMCQPGSISCDMPERVPAIKVLLLPKDTNALGTIFGGVILSHVDLAVGGGGAQDRDLTAT